MFYIPPTNAEEVCYIDLEFASLRIAYSLWTQIILRLLVDSNENEKKELWPFASKRVSDYCSTPNWRSIKEDFHVQGAWHSAHTLPKMVHGQVFRIITRHSHIDRASLSGTRWSAVYIWALGAFTSTRLSKNKQL